MVNTKHQKKKMGSIDYGVFYVVIVLLAIGVVMVYSASSYYAMYHDKVSSTYYLVKQAISAVAGFIAMFFFMSVDYHLLKKVTVPLMIITIPLLLVVRLFPPVNGAQRWIPLGPFGSFQPSELAKYVVVLFLAMSMANKGEKIKELKNVVFYIGIAGFYAGLILAQKNLSIASLIMIVTFIMIFCDGAKKKHLFCYVAPVLLVAVAVFTLGEDYRRDRLLNFLDPWKDASGNGYQLIQSFYALGAGGITGLGLGQSRQKTLYMPEPHNDFIFSIIGEELGLIGCLVIIALFVFLIWRGIKVALSAKDVYGMLLAIGITSVIGVQAIINIAVVTGSMPVTGVPLPFISYGGTSLAITMTAVGILLNISRQKDKEVNYKKVT